MSPALTALLLIATGGLCTTVGALGMLRGREVASTRGPGTLMHYPAPLPWLRKKVTAARWVVWIGRLYTLAGLSCLLGAWLVLTVQQGPNDLREHTCREISQQVLSTHADALRGGSTRTSIEADGCTGTLLDARGVRWFAIRSIPSARLMGKGFAHSRGELERRGFIVKLIDGIGHRAAIATPKPNSSLNPVLLFDDARGHHQIELNTRTTDAAGQNRLIAGFRDPDARDAHN
jgi:hypothetical protein